MAHRTVTGAAIVPPDPVDTEILADTFSGRSPNSIWVAAARLEPRVLLRWRLFVGLVFVAACLAAALWFTRPAAAQQRPPWMGPPCAAYADVVARLAAEYHETMMFMGVTAQGGLMELFASGEGGTWTILDIKPKGVACIAVAGKGFETKPVGEATAFSPINHGGWR